MHYLILRNSYQVSLQLQIRNITTKLLRLGSGRRMTEHSHLLGSRIVDSRHLSFCNKLIVSTGCVFYVLLSEGVARWLFVHLRPTRWYQVVILRSLNFLINCVGLSLGGLVLSAIVVCYEHLIKVYSFVVHLVVVAELLKWLFKWLRLLILLTRLSWKSYQVIFIPLVLILIQNLSQRRRAFDIFVFSQ
jgi:hypothetical protein